MTKLTAILLLVGCLHVTARGLAQHITLKEKSAPLPTVLKKIQKQSGFSIIYRDEWMKKATPVSVDIKANTLQEALKACLKDQPFTFTIDYNTILLHPKKTQGATKSITVSVVPQPEPLKGRVTDTAGNPIEGVSVFVKGTKHGTVTDKDGYFKLDMENYTDKELAVSFIGYKSRTISLSGRHNLNILLQESDNKLDEVMMQAYGTTTQRLTTGDIGTVTAKEIEKQPIADPLAALVGRVPGLTVVQNSGLPGSSFKVQIRGRTSINTNISNDPLFIIDGVPFANNNNSISPVFSALTSSGGLSPFNLIAPSDIESISVLKDAAATSIYGSRGANGVVLITTKKGKAGKTQINANVYTGISKVPKRMDLLNTQQYVSMRREAFANDGVTPTAANAQDIFLWDTTRYTDWQQYLIGNTAHTLDATIGLSGGNTQTQFLVGGGYHRETTVFPGDLHDGRASAHFNITHQSVNKKFNLTFSGSYANDINHLSGDDLTGSSMLLSPNTPPLYKADGELNFSENGFSFSNPLSNLKATSTAKTDNYIANLLLSYQVLKGLTIKSSFGYNGIYINGIHIMPIASQDPQYNPVGYAYFNNSNFKSLIAEPQIEYNNVLGPGRLNILVGGTWQYNTNYSLSITGSGYTNDNLLESIDAAGSILDKDNTSTQYKYAALFGIADYNIKDKYLLNISARRDGSSRFALGNQFANFGAVGAGWIFSNETGIKNALKFLSFGKIRGSYGSSGNDKIGDYQYLDSWTVPSQTYLNTSGLYPERLYNPDYRWEVNKKLEVGMDLGFFEDKLLLTASWYRNRSSSQLVAYALPSQTGGSSITANFPALVENSGWEFTLNSTNIKTRDFSWDMSFNLSIPKNKLISFPDFESSSYAQLLVIGKPLNIYSGYKVKGVNKQTGLYDYLKKDGNVTSQPVYPDDYTLTLHNKDPNFYGGVGNNFRYKGIAVSFFMDFKNQIGANYYGNALSGGSFPGMAANFPTKMLNRWTLKNNQARFQKYTQSYSSPTAQATFPLLSGADIFYSSASFIRMRNISLAYSFPKHILERFKLNAFQIYINAQNVFTITSFDGTDPEIQNIYRLPQLRSFVAGVKIIL